MAGHECSEVLISELDFSTRLDAEYYQKIHLKYKHKVENLPHKYLSNVANFLIGPFGSTYDTSNYVDIPDYRYVRGQDVKPFELLETSPRYMAKEDYERLSKYALIPGDILVSVVGTIGNTCIVREKDVPGIFSCKSTVIRTKNINPYYLTCYLNSKYGKSLLVRQERGAIQKGLNLDDLKAVIVPEFSDSFQLMFETLLKDVELLQDKSNRSFTEAEEMLLARIGIDMSAITNGGVSVKSFTESFGSTGRLDAEYYQPKYDDFENHVLNYSEGCTTPGDEFELVKTKCSRELTEYPYVEIGDIDIGNGSSEYHVVATENLPANAKIMTQKGDLLVSTVRPYRGAVSILNKDNLLVSGAFTVLREKGTYPAQTLQVLFRTSLYKDWLLKFNVGTSYPVIKDDDILKIPIPLLDESMHNRIKEFIQKSQLLLSASKQLLECAKRAVEIAIDQDETTAQSWLESKISNLTKKE